jgi:hypothetical protein
MNLKKCHPAEKECAAPPRVSAGRRILWRVIFTAAALTLHALAPDFALAATISTGNATEFNITVKRVSLCVDSVCSGRFILGNSSKDFDVASASVGQEVGSYADITGISLGVTYSHLEIQFGRSLKITGQVNVGGGTVCFTDSSDTSGSVITPSVGKKTGPATSQTLFIPDVGAFGGQPTEAVYAAAGLTITDETTATGIVALSQSFTVTESPPQIHIRINTQSAIGAAELAGNCVMLVQAPTATITLK